MTAQQSGQLVILSGPSCVGKRRWRECWDGSFRSCANHSRSSFFLRTHTVLLNLLTNQSAIVPNGALGREVT